MLKQLLPLLIALIYYNVLSAQVVTIDPPFPTQNDDVTITFNAALGNGDLEGVQPIYAHTGLITENSTDPTDWQYVVSAWGIANPTVLMTSLGNNLHEISFNIQDFYNYPNGEEVYQLAFVFRNTSGSIVGRNADGSDIYIDLFSEGFAGSISSPFEPQIFFDAPASLTFTAETNQEANISLYLDDTQLTSAAGVTQLSTDVDFTAMPAGQYWLWMEAESNGTVVSDSVYVILQGDPVIAESPAGVVDGINYIDDQTVILQIFAPMKEFIYVLGDFNGWQFGTNYFMNQTPDGEHFWLEIGDLNPAQEYRFQYSIDEMDMRVADIYADKILDPFNDPFIPESVYPDLISYPTGLTSDIVSVLQTAQIPYQWQSTTYQRPSQENLVIYELLIRDFDQNHSYHDVINRLPYLAELGINAIELMPFTEFEGNESWGYNPMFYFAADKYYGTKNDLKALIDSCHGRGIAVIQDVVLNHSFGQNPQLRMYSESNSPSGPPSANSPYFNVSATHPFNVGYDYNHDKPATQAFVDRNLKYWAQEYKIDGFRFDLSKGFTQNITNNVGSWNQYDQSRVDNWIRIRDGIYEYDNQIYIILEHLGDNPEETVLANNNMMLWGNINHEFNEASMGYNSNLNWANYQSRNWNNPRLVSFAESHDEERLMYKNLEFGNSSGSYDVTNLETALARQEAVAALLIPLRGPKMIWQFGELGYDYSINSCPDGSINNDCRTSNKPIRWDYLDQPARQHLYKVHGAINKLKTENAAFTSDTYNYDVAGFGKRLIITADQMDVVIIANFNVEPITMVPGFTHTGTWYNYLEGSSIIEDNLDNGFLLQPGEYRIYTDIELETPDLAVGTDEVSFHGGSLLHAYPNPFSTHTQISYTLEKSDNVRLIVFDLQGRIVASINHGLLSQGNHVVQWDGSDQNGSDCENGIYFVQVMTGNGRATAKVVLTR